MSKLLTLTVIATALVGGSAIAATDTSAGKTVHIESGKAANFILAREGSSGGNRQRRGGEGGAASDAPVSADQLAREGSSGGHRQRRGGEGGAASDSPSTADQMAREGASSGGNRQRRSGTV